MRSQSRSFILRTDENAQALYAFLKEWWRQKAADGKPLVVTVEQYKAKASDSQRKRYWAIMAQIAAGASVNGKQFSKEAWHEHFKREFIGIEELPGGSTVGMSSTTIDIGEHNEYTTKVEVYAAQELGIEII